MYGLVSDFVPLFGRRRKSYFLVTSTLAGLSGAALGLLREHPYWPMAVLFTVMGFGLAFTDVLTDALMVETGKPLGLTGAFQAVQWAAIYIASVLVGEIGGGFAEGRDLRSAFLVAAAFPLVSLVMVAIFVREPPRDRRPRRLPRDLDRHPRRPRRALGLARRRVHPLLHLQPVVRPAAPLLPDQRLKFSQQFIGRLLALAALGAVAGRPALRPAVAAGRPPAAHQPLDRGHGARHAGVPALPRPALAPQSSTRGTACVYMVTQLAFLDLAAKACPRRVEATFFALLMSVYNAGQQLSQNVGARLYETWGFTPLVLISAAMTAAMWLLVPFLDVKRLEAQAHLDARVSPPDAPLVPPSA